MAVSDLRRLLQLRQNESQLLSGNKRLDLLYYLRNAEISILLETGVILIQLKQGKQNLLGTGNA